MRRLCLNTRYSTLLKRSRETSRTVMPSVSSQELLLFVLFFFLMIRRPPRSTLFPSTPLFRSCCWRRARRWPSSVRRGRAPPGSASASSRWSSAPLEWFSRGSTSGGSGGRPPTATRGGSRSEEHTSELQSLAYLVCRLLLEKKK